MPSMTPAMALDRIQVESHRKHMIVTAVDMDPTQRSRLLAECESTIHDLEQIIREHSGSEE